jgi:hypothetical protein
MSGTDESDPLFTIIVPAESICDVAVTLRVVDNEAATVGGIPVGATLGQVYYAPLDGNTTALWVPVGVSVLP